MTELLTAVSIIFIIAGPLLLLANRFRLSAIPALIIAGLFAGFFIEEDLTLELARLGIALLVFTFSVRIHTDRVRLVVTDSEVVAIGQAVILGLLGMGVALLFEVAPADALYVGIAAALSSTIVGTTLFQPTQRDIVHDHLSATINNVQDLLAILVLLTLGAGAFALDPIATQLGYGVMLLALAVVVNRYLFDIIARLAKGSDESLLVGIVALLILFLALAEVVGVSVVVGAFAAGIAIRDDPVNHSDVLNGLDSIKDFFTAIFFVTVGALVTVPSVETFLLALSLLFLVVVVKPIFIIAMLVYKGYDRRSATLTGLDLDHVGEFGIIVAIEGLVLGVLGHSIFDAIILAAATSMILSSLTHYYDEQIYRTLVRYGWLGQPHHKAEDWNNARDDLSDHFVIVGYGRQGRLLADFCEDAEQQYVVIENNPALLDDLRENCNSYLYADAIEAETGELANVTDAKLIISTVASKSLTDHFLSFSDQTDVIVRTRETPAAKALLERGALYVIVSDLLAADQLSEALKSLIEEEADPRELQKQSLRELDVEGAPEPTATDSIDLS